MKSEAGSVRPVKPKGAERRIMRQLHSHAERRIYAAAITPTRNAAFMRQGPHSATVTARTHPAIAHCSSAKPFVLLLNQPSVDYFRYNEWLFRDVPHCE